MINSIRYLMLDSNMLSLLNSILKCYLTYLMFYSNLYSNMLSLSYILRIFLSYWFL